MAKRKQKRVTAVEARPTTDTDGKPAGMVDVGLVVNAEDVVEGVPDGVRDPELYELRTYGGITSWSPTTKRCDQLRVLYKEHVKSLEPDGHWKGPCYADAPADLVGDVREAMDFHGSLVDNEQPLAGGGTRLHSEGYWAHGV
jgi:hypothetical protein